ncbi:TPA: hypothetical protein PXM15_000944 [Yersinia enterocolitica]|nr:hypothetical protein [Yersinia enterocolitica]
MTVSTEINHEDFVGNGITTVFPYRFRILKASNMVVVTIDTDGNETNMVLNTDFTVSGAGSYNGGNVTLSTPLPLGWVVTLTRQLALVQETDLRNQGTFFAEMHENAFDYLTMLIQQSVLWSDLSLRRQTFLSQFFNAEGRRVSNAGNPTLPQDLATKLYTDTLAQSVDAHTLRVPEASIPILPIASQRANKVLTFDGAGNAIVTVPASGSAADVLIQLAKPTGAGLIGDGVGTVATERLSIHGGKMQGSLELIGPAMNDNEPATLAQLKQYAGEPVGRIIQHTNRATIDAGCGPLDGQELSRALFPDIFAKIAAGYHPLVSDAEWLADTTKRTSFTLGNGSTTFRMADWNGKYPGSAGAVVFRGDGAKSTGVNGLLQMDALAFHNHGAVVTTGVQGTGGVAATIAIPIIDFVGSTSSVRAPQRATESLVTGVLGANTAVETRMLNATGVWIIKLAGNALNSGQIDALQLATQIAALTTRVNTLEAGWSWGGTLERGWRKDPHGMIEQWGTDNAASGTPATITLPIPFPASFVTILTQVMGTFAAGAAESNTKVNKASLSTFTIYSGTAGTFTHSWRVRGY